MNILTSPEPIMEQLNFTSFIADRLRGIPLVSGGRKREAERSTSQEGMSTGASKMVATEPIGKLQILPPNMSPPKQQRTRQVTPETGILFANAGITASTASLVRNNKRITTTSTTRRPPTTRKLIRTSSTTMKYFTTPKPTTTTSTTTKRPVLAKMLRPVIQLDQDQSSTIYLRANQTEEDKKLIKPAAAPETANLRVDSIERTQFTNAPNLTRSTQTLTTRPDNQRRQQQTVVSSRFVNKPHDNTNQFAGENWALFSRPDGQFSMFETLALLSNILIVSTIVIVIIFGWIKSIRKKRASKNQTTPPTVETLTLASRSPNSMQLEGLSEQTGKTSRLSSALSDASRSDNAGLVSTEKNANTINNGLATKYCEKGSNKSTIEPSVPSSQAPMISASNSISNEFKSGSNNLLNKATAIVQPTENNIVSNSSASGGSDKLSKSSPKSEVLSLGNQQRTISRSTSDLSGIQKPSQHITNETERVVALENLFNNSVPNLSHLEDQPESSKLKGNREKNGSNFRLSTCSLESIDLPPTLVESIQRSDVKKLPKEEAPSPNLLLGEVVTQQTLPATSRANNENQKEPTKGTELVNKEPPVLKKDVDLSEEKKQEVVEVKEREKNQHRKNEKKDESSTINGNNKSKEPKTTKTTAKNGNSKSVSKSEESGAVKLESDRPGNPMGKNIEDESINGQKPAAVDNSKHDQSTTVETAATKLPSIPAEVKNHQMVVNKLDKRKTNLEIVDLRDESVTGKMRQVDGAKSIETNKDDSWISMDGVAVVQPTNSGQTVPPAAAAAAQVPGLIPVQSPTVVAATQQQQGTQQAPLMSPSEIIESRFNVDYGGKSRKSDQLHNTESIDSKTENNIENELEKDNKMRHRKYFVYVVHDGHFTAKKECIARIELPPKRRITLAELRQVIASSQDISLSSLRRNKFKFVTETYRLLNENEDAAVLHQVYPTQGVFLKLNIPEQDNQVYPFKAGRSRLSSGSGPASSSLSHTTISSRQRTKSRTSGDHRESGPSDSSLPAIEVDYPMEASAYGRTRASSVGRSRLGQGTTKPIGAYKRSRSSVQPRQQQQREKLRGTEPGGTERLPTLGRSTVRAGVVTGKQSSARRAVVQPKSYPKSHHQSSAEDMKQSLGSAATEIGANVISGAKRLFNATFSR